MTASATSLAPADYKSKVEPIWCPGCGHYGVLAALSQALAQLKRPRHEVAVISGIGCSSRVPAYTSVYGFHGVHGRALAVATGLKIARPDLTVIVCGGDGDGLSIGGNHFMHACRRNVDITYIVMDNQVYGMTKGQASPTTESAWTGSKLTPQGPGVTPVNPSQLALACGANYVARGYSGRLPELAGMIAKGITHPGFSLVHVLSPCSTYRPEQRNWRRMAHPSDEAPAERAEDASRAMLQDDGLTVGTFLLGQRRPYPTPTGPCLDGLPADIEREFLA